MIEGGRINTPSIKVVVEYWGHWRNPDSHDYRIAKITGAVTVDVIKVEHNPLAPQHKTARVGDMLTEQQAAELAERVDMITMDRKET